MATLAERYTVPDEPGMASVPLPQAKFPLPRPKLIHALVAQPHEHAHVPLGQPRLQQQDFIN